MPPRKKSSSRNGSHGGKKKNSFGFELREIEPKTYAQKQVFESFLDNHLVLHGLPGTGKTFLSMYLALREVLEYNTFQRIVIIRSAVQTRNLGFMPGNLLEKMAYYEMPYQDIVNDLCSRGDAYDILKQRGAIEFMSTSFIRGLTISNAIIIVDESQNCEFEEINSVMTRVGGDSKIIFSGDMKQTDLKTDKERSGFKDFMRILERVKDFDRIEFGVEDIVRSGLVKRYLIEKIALGL